MAYDCPLCDRANSADNMVQCEECGYWFHYSCAGVNQSIENEDRSFICQKCQRLDCASASDFKSISSHTTNHETAEQLKLLDEMKTIHLRKLDAEQERQRKIVEQEEAFKLKRLEAEEQFINKKMELLALSRGMHTAQTSAGVINEISHHKEVQNWISNQQKQVATLGMGPGKTNRIGLPIGDERRKKIVVPFERCQRNTLHGLVINCHSSAFPLISQRLRSTSETFRAIRRIRSENRENLISALRDQVRSRLLPDR